MTSTPVTLGEKPYGVSPSRVNQIETCPRQYQYSTVLRIPEPKKMATYRGTAFHAVLEEMFNRTAESPRDRTVDYTLTLMREMFRESLMTPEYAAEMELDEVGIQTFGRDLAKYIRTYFTMEDPTRITSEGIEIKFDVDMGGYLLRGILDRLDRLPTGELEIVDYKTGKVPQSKYKDSAILPAKIYAYMCREQLGEVPKQIRLLYVQFGKTLTIPVTDADMDYAEKRVREAWAKIENWYELGFFPPIANNLCMNWCAFKSICPLFAVPETTPF
jgi:putative RecB family exonuclease